MSPQARRLLQISLRAYPSPGNWPTSYVCPPLIILYSRVPRVCSYQTTISFFIMQLLSSRTAPRNPYGPASARGRLQLNRKNPRPSMEHLNPSSFCNYLLIPTATKSILFHCFLNSFTIRRTFLILVEFQFSVQSVFNYRGN